MPFVENIMAKYNLARTAKMREKTDGQLKVFVEAKTLSSAAAAYELTRRTTKQRNKNVDSDAAID